MGWRVEYVKVLVGEKTRTLGESRETCTTRDTNLTRRGLDVSRLTVVEFLRRD